MLNSYIKLQTDTQSGAIARSVAMSFGNQEAPRSILASGTSFREDLVMGNYFYGHPSSSAKGCALSTMYLPREGLTRNSVYRLTDRPDMTSAVDRGRKTSTKTNK